MSETTTSNDIDMGYDFDYVPDLKLRIISPITYKFSTSSSTNKKVVICTFEYRLDMNDNAWNKFVTSMRSITRFLDEESDPFAAHTVCARATVSNNDEYVASTGKKIARAKAESIAYKVLSRQINNLVNKKIKLLESAFNLFNKKSSNVQNHNVDYITKIGG